MPENTLTSLDTTYHPLPDTRLECRTLVPKCWVVNAIRLVSIFILFKPDKHASDLNFKQNEIYQIKIEITYQLRAKKMI